MNFPVFDLHCDTALALLGSDGTGTGSLRRNELHIDLTRAAALPGYAQCFACFTTPGIEAWHGLPAQALFQQELAGIRREVENCGDLIRFAASGGEVERNRNAGKCSAILTIEGPAGFGFDPGRLEDLHRMGFRISTLGWNEDNVLSGSHVTGGGLTDLGRVYVREAQALGILIDVSHLSDQGFWDLMEITQGPILATHSNSRAVHPVSRNLTDDMFRTICRTGGVAGINLYSDFIGENADLNRVCDHIFHFLELDPTGSHIALGGDLDGCDRLPVGFAGIQDYPKLARCLLERGLDETTVHKIFWDNAIGVMNRCCM